MANPCQSACPTRLLLESRDGESQRRVLALIFAIVVSSNRQKCSGLRDRRQVFFVTLSVSIVVNSSYIFAVGTGVTKVSILLFYRRLAANAYTPLLKRAIIGTLWFVILNSTMFTLVVIFYCWPIEAYWKQFSYPIPYDKEYKCLDEGRSIIVCAVMSILTDFLTTLLPLLIFTGLNVPIRQKISLGIIFGLGFMLVLGTFKSTQGLLMLILDGRVCAAGIVRTVYLYELFHKTYDITWVGCKCGTTRTIGEYL